MKGSNGTKVNAVRTIPEARSVYAAAQNHTPGQPDAPSPGRLDYHRERLGGLINHLETINDMGSSLCGRLGLPLGPAESKGVSTEKPGGMLDEIDERLSRLSDFLDWNERVVRALQQLG